MAFKVVRYGTGNEQMPQPSQQQAPQQSQIMQIPEQSQQKFEQGPEYAQSSNFLGRLGIKGLEGIEQPFHLLNTLTQALGGPNLQTNFLPSQDLARYLNYSPQQQEPQNVLERFSGRLLQQAPYAAVGGLPALARTAVSNIPATLAGEAGATEGIQDLTQIGSDIGANLLTGKFGNKLGKYAKYNPYQGNIQTLNQAQKAGYKGAKESVPQGLRQSATHIAEGIAETKERLGTEVNKAISGKVQHFIDKVKDNFNSMFERPGVYSTAIDPKKALDIRRKTYALEKAMSRKYPQFEDYTRPVTDGINKFFAEYGVDNPDFIKHLNRADQLTQAKHIHSYLADLVEKLPLGANVVSTGIKGIGKGLVGATLGVPEKFIRNYVKNPRGKNAFRELVNSNIKAAASNNIPALMKGLAEMNKEEIQESLPSPTNKSSGNQKVSFKVVRYGAQ